MKIIIVLVAITICFGFSYAAIPEDSSLINDEYEKVNGNSVYLNANDILFFISNVGVVARDLQYTFYDIAGMYFPYTSIEYIESQRFKKQKTCIYSGGIWISGIDNNSGDTLVSLAEFRRDFVPGPMSDNTFQEDMPEFKVYKLYGDSLENNPNEDFLNWPEDQGAPVDNEGNPLVKGKQMSWTVFNDANEEAHNSNYCQSAPIGVEIQQTAWVYDEQGDNNLYFSYYFEVDQEGSLQLTVDINITEPHKANGDTLDVIVDVDSITGESWSLVNRNSGEIILENQTDFTKGSPIHLIEGFEIDVYLTYKMFSSFEFPKTMTHTWSTPLGAAISSVGFPSRSLSNLQQEGEGRWAIHTADLADDEDDLTYASYEKFLEQTLNNYDSTQLANLGKYDWEIRFTGNGSYAYDITTGTSMWVPFELWRIGINTPKDESDDVRCVVWVEDDGNGIFDLSSYGSPSTGCGPAGCEHSALPGADEAFTDQFYWRIPNDTTSGEQGYYEEMLQIRYNSETYSGINSSPVMDKMVLINATGGVAPPFNQDMPELGSVFRIRTFKGYEPDTFFFKIPVPELVSESHPISQTVFMEYKFYNKGNKDLRDCYFTMWFDPDIGYAGDDLVGCDTALGIGYMYNSNNNDYYYGTLPPAMGFKFVRGILTPSDPYDIGWFGDSPINGFTNSDIMSFRQYINGDSPTNVGECYNMLRGLKRDGTSLNNGSKFEYTGDPVQNIGEVDDYPYDKRMLGSVGPFDFAPGDSQYVLIKVAAGLGDNRLLSVANLKEVMQTTYPEYDNLRTLSNPKIIELFELNTVEETDHTIYIKLGYSQRMHGSDIDWNSVKINGRKNYDSLSVSDWVMGFTGEAGIFYYDIQEFIEPLQPIFDTVTTYITVSGITENGTAFIKETPLTLIGHMSGDINNDNNVDILDLTMMIDYLFQGYRIQNIQVADVNHDGMINIVDLTTMINKIFVIK
ncbi:MAG: dockerin type I repeat-containing protein [candidate division Zixibacteria bacterium]|nr:dockerin type I repeat-containing protein [candidate division Zixibacteria bacterium]